MSGGGGVFIIRMNKTQSLFLYTKTPTHRTAAPHAKVHSPCKRSQKRGFEIFLLPCFPPRSLYKHTPGKARRDAGFLWESTMEPAQRRDAPRHCCACNAETDAVLVANGCAHAPRLHALRERCDELGTALEPALRAASPPLPLHTLCRPCWFARFKVEGGTLYAVRCYGCKGEA